MEDKLVQVLLVVWFVRTCEAGMMISFSILHVDFFFFFFFACHLITTDLYSVRENMRSGADDFFFFLMSSSSFFACHLSAIDLYSKEVIDDIGQWALSSSF